ncbi:hypothetical protein FRB97_002076 [Tulasnella sp. 331]|nr:hypothetical protein FRB97_002076 [Tulasnella sp. 331]
MSQFTFDDSDTSSSANGNATLTYSPPTILATSTCHSQPDNNACTGYWWSEPGIHDTWGPNTSFTFEFTGECDSVTMYGLFGNAAGYGVYTIDGGQQQTFGQYDSNQPLPWVSQPCFTINDLDPTQKHSLVVSYDNSHYLDNAGDRLWLSLDYLTYTRNTVTTTS